MKKIYLNFAFTFVAILFSTIYLNAQISHGGTPLSFTNTKNELLDIKYKIVYATNLPQLKADDAIRDKSKSYPWRFGENIDVNYTMENSGEWDILPKGEKVWRLGIYSPGALSLNLTYSDFYIPEGGQLFIYNSDKTEVIGAFTHENNKVGREFATTLIAGEAIIIEYNESVSVSSKASIQINIVTHGYRNAFDYAEKALGSSGSCNNNVACPESAGWEDQIKSVAMMVSGSSGFCTGSMVNNTANDGTPYFLTADHCYSNPATWIFWFNWQSATCANPGSSPAHDDISGAILRARNSASDFCLVELSSTPPAGYGIYYNGWNRENIASTNSVGIHHPSGDIKKISFDNDASVSSDYAPAPYLANSHWEVTAWDDGTTEGGSSGSPLYDQNYRVIGQLHGGWASCSSITQDYYGKFSMSWDYSATTSAQLEFWLDPSGTNPLVIDGYDPNGVSVNTDAQLLNISVPVSSYCGVQTVSPTVTIKNNGIDTLISVDVTYDIDGGTPVVINWSGSLATGASEVVAFPAIILTVGAHTMNAGTSNPNGITDENTVNDNSAKNYDVFSGSGALPYVELFESGTFPPPCWISFIGTNGLGTGSNWTTSTISSEGSNAAFVQYENVAGGTAEDWLVTPLLDLTGTTSNFLTFYERDQWANNFGSSYLIKVSTNSQATHGDFSDVITYTENDLTTSFVKRTVDLSAYDGQNIYIAFVMDQDNGDNWYIDSLLVDGTIASVAPVADFIAATTTLCNAGSTIFTDLSSNTPTSWSWSFSPTTVTYISATNANSQNPEVQFDASGTYTVTLTATNTNGSDVMVQTGYITVSGALPASNSIATGTPTICAGDNVDFTTTPTNEGTTPTYDWQVNGSSVGTGTTFSSTTLNDGDVVTCILTSSLGCATGNPATSNSVTMTVSAVLPVSNIIAGTTSICVGDNVTFTTTPTNEGTTPTYDWQVNGSSVGTGTTFSSTTLNDDDVVTCILTSSETCASGNPATSNAETMTVDDIPVVGFTSSSYNYEASFTNTSTNAISYFWDFGDGNTSTATDPNHTYAAYGTYTITLIATNACGSDTTTLIIDIITSIGDLNSDNFIEIYPNPNNGIFTVKYANDENENITFKIFNSTAQLIYNESVEKHSNVISKDIDMSQYSNGIYHLQIITNSNTYIEKIVVE
ncbi:MAG: PKD domain-containing protein [Bacteroidetes bacterium]|jgi:lysyl endopeptidase|nr:PKD domain-containing protein [Bacteroidota bacterium]